jgi:hypothetical protein
MLLLDGVYVERPDGSLRFRQVPAPANQDVIKTRFAREYSGGR